MKRGKEKVRVKLPSTLYEHGIWKAKKDRMAMQIFSCRRLGGGELESKNRNPDNMCVED